MPLTAEELAPVITRLLQQHRKERPRLDRIAAYVRNKVDSIYVPQGATDEFRMLVDQARFNVLPLIEDSIAQNLFVDGYRPTDLETGRAPSSRNAAVWDAVWQPNRLDARQAAFYRPAVRYGYSYATVVPGEPAPVITPWSPRKLTALYDDPVNDEWPIYAMVAQRPPVKPLATGEDPLATPTVEAGAKLTVYDNEFRYHVVKDAGSWRLLTDAEEHNLGVVPVVRFLDQVGDEEEDGVVSIGKIEPLLPVQRQLNQTTYGLLMAQHYAAFKQRWVTGMADEDPKFRARVDAFLRSDSPDTKFGEFSETDLTGYLNSRDKVLLYISAVAQIPPHNLLVGSGISNISAEALAALESAHRHDILEHQTTLGESVEQLLRLAGKAMGDSEAWDDTSAQVVWRDTTPRSLAQVADALGKLAQQLGIPQEALWDRIPGVTDQDKREWKELRDEQGALDALAGFEREIARMEAPDAVGVGRPANGAASTAA